VSGEKLLRGNVAIFAAYPQYAADPYKPTVGELNNIFDWTVNQQGKVFNISCAIMDDYTLNQAESDTDSDMTICDITEVNDPTFFNYEASLDGLRDKDIDFQGLYNLYFWLFNGFGRDYVLIKRIGPGNQDAFANGQVISLYGVTTDVPVDLIDDNAKIKFGARFQNTGQFRGNYKIGVDA
jgi:hypothetical protein